MVEQPEEQPVPALPSTRRARSNPGTAFLAALQFLVISPAFIRRPFTPQELGSAVGFYPLVGLLLGVLLAALQRLSSQVFPPMVAAALVLAAWIILTGALHLDGFLDSCDGLFGGWTPEKRLAIMRDHHIGAYALAGGVALLLLKFSALASVNAEQAAAAMVLAPILSRWGISMAIVLFPYGRSEGLGRQIKDHAGATQAVLACLLAAAALAAAWLGAGVSLWACMAAAGFSVLALLGMAAVTRRLIPGLTGDTYGAINELIEMAVLLVFTASW